MMQVEGHTENKSEAVTTTTPVFDNVKDKNGKVIPQWQVDLQRKIFEGKQKRFNKLAEEYNGRLNAMLDMYFTYLTGDEEENTSLFNTINKEWMDLTHKANATQKIIKLQHDAFSKNVKDIMESDEFKEKLKARLSESEEDKFKQDGSN